MEVTCVFFGPIREVVGQKSVALRLDDEATVGDAFDTLCASYEGLEQYLAAGETVGQGVTTTVDKRNVNQLAGLDTRVEDGSVLRLAPPIVGGAG